MRRMDKCRPVKKVCACAGAGSVITVDVGVSASPPSTVPEAAAAEEERGERTVVVVVVVVMVVVRRGRSRFSSSVEL